LAAAGTPDTTIEALKGAIGPTKFSNANDMNREALLTGSSALGGMAEKQQAFEQNPEYKKQLIMAKAQMQDPLRREQFEALKDERKAKHYEALDKRVDTQTARFGNIARIQGVNNTIQEAKQLLQGDIYNMNVAELAKTLDRVLSQAAPTIAGTKEITPHTLKQDMARVKEYMTGDPQKVDIPKFIDFYNKTLNRIESVNNGIIKGAQKNVLQSLAPIYKSDPETYRNYVRNKIGEDIEMDRKTGQVKFIGAQKQAQEDPMAGFTPVTVINKQTGQPERLFRGPDGKLYKN
jgi:hypothetical protein